MFEYQICRGSKAYDAAFSLVNPPSLDNKKRHLREAAFRFSRAMVNYLRTYEFYPLLAERWYWETVLENGYIWPPDFLDPVVSGVDHAANRAETQDYFFSRALQLLERYVVVVDELQAVELSDADAFAIDRPTSDATGNTFQNRRLSEFRQRSRALQAVLGEAASVVPCLVDSRAPALQVALAALREEGGDIAQAQAAVPNGATWVDRAADQIREDSVARSLRVAAVTNGVIGPVRPTVASLPWEYHRAAAQQKSSRWNCGYVVRSVDLQKELADAYADGAAAPSFDSAPSLSQTIALIDGTLFGQIDFTERSRTCFPTQPAQSAGERPMVGPYELLDAIRALLFAFDGSYQIYDRNTALGAPASGHWVAIQHPLLEQVRDEIESLVGTVRARWTLDPFQGVLQVTPGAELPQPLDGYLVVGRAGLEDLAAQRLSASDLAGQPLSDGGDDVWPWRAYHLASTAAATVTIPQVFDHPLRDSEAWAALCDGATPRSYCDRPDVQRNADFADDIFLLREAIPTGGLNADGTLRTAMRPMTVYLYFEYNYCPAGESCFPVSDGRQGLVVDFISGASLKYHPNAHTVTHRRGGKLQTRAERILARETDHCGEARYNSLGLPKRLVPPLENELIDNLDPYENSFRTYLGRARQAAERAATIASQAREREAALDQDVREAGLQAEQLVAEATETLESICGAGAGLDGCSSARQDISIGDIGTGAGVALLPPADVLVDLTALTEAANADATAQGDRLAYCEGLSRLTLPYVPEAGDTDTIVRDYGTALDVYRLLAQCALLVSIESTRRLVVPDLPLVLHDGELSLEEEESYGGQYKTALVALETELLSFSNSVISVATTMKSLDQQFLGARSHIGSLLTSEQGKDGATMEMAGNALQSVISGAVGGASVGGAPGAVVGAGVGAVAGGLSTAGRYQQLQDQYRREEAGAEAYVRDFIAGVFGALGDMRMAANTMEISRNQLVSRITDLEQLELEQDHARSRAERMLTILQTQVFDPFVWTTATRENYRAHEAIRRSKVASYIARMAIEFRLLVDLSREKATNAAVEAPSDWADNIFVLENRVAELAPVDGSYVGIGPLTDPITLATTEYVDHLEDYVAFYSFDYPFQGNSDTAVLSLKDDLRSDEFSCALDATTLDSRGLAAGTQQCRCLDEAGDPASFTPAIDYAEDCFAAAPSGESYRVDVPYDYDGELFRKAFKKKCVADSQLRTYDDPACLGGDIEYYQFDFVISLADIEGGELVRYGQIASGRYNYRLEDVAINLVGSNVKDCSQTGVDISACYANAFLPVSLVQAGQVELRDHGGNSHTYRMHPARIQSGKALAAERFLTSPLSQADAALIQQYQNPELRGRPLQGTYSIRIDNVSSFQFEELEDVQLVLNYRSWTAFDSLD